MTWFMKAMAWLLLGVVLALGAIWSWSAGLNPYWPVIFVAFAGYSLFRSYKAFMEVWRSRLSKRVESQVSADKDTCLPGDAVNVSVKVTGKEELDEDPRASSLGNDLERVARHLARKREQSSAPPSHPHTNARGCAA